MAHPTRRNSLRCPGFDYSSPAGVFVTITTYDRQPLFCLPEDEDNENELSPAGIAAQRLWQRIPKRFPDVMTDAFVVMPDHIHGVVWMGCAEANPPTSCGEVVRWFKSSMLREFTVGVANNGWQPYSGRLWQRGYYDHIIRGDKDLAAIRNYIDANPYA